MRNCIILATTIILLAGCIPNGLKPMSERLKDPEYVKYLEEKRLKKDAETLKIIGLTNIKNIYLGSFGNQDGADLVREKIRAEISQTSRFNVVEKKDSADAILTGVAGVNKSSNQLVQTDIYGNTYVSSGNKYLGVGILRLVDIQTDSVIWNYQYSRGLSLGSVSTRVANQVVERLINDAKSADELKTRMNSEALINKGVDDK